MSTDFELEEFNGLGTTLAPRIPNAENRNIEAKVIGTKYSSFNFRFIRTDRHETTTLSINTK